MEEISKTKKKQQDRNAKKYYKKALSALKEFKNINIITSPSKCLFIGNGGMLCGQSRESLLILFSQYGNVEDLVMIPKKSFSFVQYNNTESAQKASLGLHGHNTTPDNSESVAPFYIQMLDIADLGFAKDIRQNKKYPKENEEIIPINGLYLEQEIIDTEYEETLFNFFQNQCSALAGKTFSFHLISI